jgi:hypothetical protein
MAAPPLAELEPASGRTATRRRPGSECVRYSSARPGLSAGLRFGAAATGIAGSGELMGPGLVGGARLTYEGFRGAHAH